MSDAEKEFDPEEIEESEDDGTTRADGIDHDDEPDGSLEEDDEAGA